MTIDHNTKIPIDGLKLLLDAASPRSALMRKQSSNILVDPHTWSSGTGGATGYGANGSASEQSRAIRTDPWGRQSMTWRSTPDATSGADGGWNSQYYSIDRNYTYRWSVFVRRYTSGTGGTFYMGLNPAPIRNDNDTSQSNPYWTYPAISLLTQDRWYWICGHCFYEGYTGGRHPQTGWYEYNNSQWSKISDKSYGNVGQQDVRWASSTTTSMHRAYHYYTTNTASGIEFAYPRIDKIDGKEPSIWQIMQQGEGGWNDLSGNGNHGDMGDHRYVTWSSDYGGVFTFTGATTSRVNTGFGNGRNPATSPTSYCLWVRPDSASGDDMFMVQGNWSSATRAYFGKISSQWGMGVQTTGWGGTQSNAAISSNTWYHIAIVFDGSVCRFYVNGSQVMTVNYTSYTFNEDLQIGGNTFDTQYNWPGKIANVMVYDRALSVAQINDIYNNSKGRFL